MARPPSVRLVDPPWIEFAKRVLAGTPNLSGAACIGRHGLFDEQAHEDGETAETAARRHQEAAELCRRCPVLGACRTAWVDTPGVRHRPSGVIGGRTPATTTRGRPRMEAS
ncbi:hypothetical protein nbrc107696_15670 [Gordonia spumicola]|uniref:4Fe-4S Wbl-type domain-containing protein n=1 Tax=Gordonia spumicola TaxID=589161 RepID=A0A7I9V7Q4_9ACTN|nr:WhiB family transcriptional regulator [Gordonia spumicola]GEE01121.1 hypothetical protein nbrc107696_15670 [Gordonia spumicola]